MRASWILKTAAHLQKVALWSLEDIVWDDIVAVPQKDIAVIKEPFPHIVVDNFFTPEVYQGLSQRFADVASLGLSDTINDATRFHLFDMDYDGYLFMPRCSLAPSDPLRIFFSLEWNMFFSKLFSQHTGFETSLAFHHHPPHNRTGFVHSDFADKYFNLTSRLPNGVIPYATLDKSLTPRRRIIALLYFLNNDGWREGMGGETGLYAKDMKTLVKKVAPINNRLLAFHISPHSMHAFQENHTPRNSFVQWFHIPKELL